MSEMGPNPDVQDFSLNFRYVLQKDIPGLDSEREFSTLFGSTEVQSE